MPQVKLSRNLAGDMAKKYPQVTIGVPFEADKADLDALRAQGAEVEGDQAAAAQRDQVNNASNTQTGNQSKAGDQNR